MNRSGITIALAVSVLGGSAAVAVSTQQTAQAPEITVYKSPT